MLIELAIGDAYGAGFEFAGMAKIKQHNHVSYYVPHELGIPAGHYTDDTQMSIAIALMLTRGGEWSKLAIANTFYEVFNRDPRKGYSSGFYCLLNSVQSGGELLEKIVACSTRNGACMRAAPLGFLNDIRTVLEYAEIQASVTHNTKEGIQSAQAIALCSYYFVNELGESKYLVEFLSDFTEINWDSKWTSPVSCSGVETVNAVISTLIRCSSLKSILEHSVNYSGDTDTVASIALGIASQSLQYERNLPSFLYGDLENGTYGFNYLESLSRELKSI